MRDGGGGASVRDKARASFHGDVGEKLGAGGAGLHRDGGEGEQIQYGSDYENYPVRQYMLPTF